MEYSTALQEAVGAGNTKQVSLLLSQCPLGAVNAPLDEEGTTLLHLAANSPSPSVLSLLLARGAIVNWQNEDGLTALHVAALWGRAEPIHTLLQQGADPEICDVDDMLPVDLAREEGHEDCAVLLEDPSLSPSSPSLLDQSMAETFVSMMLCELTTVSPLSTTPSSPELWETLEDKDRTLSYGSSDGSWTNGGTRSQGVELDVTSKVPEEGTVPGSPPPHGYCIQQIRDVSVDSSSEVGSHSEQGSLLYTTALDLVGIANGLPDSPTASFLERSFRRLEVGCSSQSSTDADTAVTTLPSCNRGPGNEAMNILHCNPKTPPSPASTQTPPTAVTPPSTAPPTVVPPSVAQLSNEQLRSWLVELGEQPGPVNSSTRHAYLNYLTKLLAGVQPTGNKGYKGYRYELALVLNGTAPVPEFSALEQQVFKSLREPRLLPHPPTPRARDGTVKGHFNYLLLDPRVAKGVVGGVVGGGGSLEQFRTFVESVFYVGKGKNARSLQHLRDAKDYKLKQTKHSDKLQLILDIWSSGHGVMSLHLFHNTTAQEAFTREACMIEAIGLGVLTNIQRGHAHGEISGWPLPRQRHFGVYLLHKALRAFLLDTPPQIYPGDL